MEYSYFLWFIYLKYKIYETTPWQFGRVVKASDSKSDGVTRVGSNPAAVEFFLILSK